MFTPPSLPLLSLLFTSVLLCSPAVASSKFFCRKKDSRTLLKIKRSFGDPPILSSWNASTDCCHEWTNIGCDADAGGRVTLLGLQDTHLAGPIPHFVSRLSHLKYLMVVGNENLTGRIPPSIGRLKHLSFLRITENPLLTGPIPKTLCHLPKLEELRLYLNSLTGPIPACFGVHANNISYVDLSINRLSGPIPSSFMRGSTAASITLNLYGNRLSGLIPASVGDLPFEFIDISENRFTDASALFGEEKTTKIMRMPRNQLEFDISNLSFPLGLQEFDANHNRITGSIPRQITKLTSVSYLDVSYNGLCGPIPDGPYLRILRPSLFAHNNCLCGKPLKPCHR